MPQPDRARILAPPPLLTAIVIGLGFVADHYKPMPIFGGDERIPMLFAMVMFFAGAAMLIAAIREFRRRREHPSPYKPTNAIIDRGIYGRTRNPIYIALLTVTLGVAGAANSFWFLGSFVLLFALLHFGVVLREERYLSAKFGAEYDAYRKRVRRWL
jgi:protein-S-isoprenylcysteine O-methyltransferase Ste14